MPQTIQVSNDVTNAKEDVQGSDARMNVSSRSDERIYYNARDKGQAYSMVFDDAACSAGDYNAVLFNTSPKADAKTLVIHSIGVNALNLASFKLHKVTGTAGGGAVTYTPLNLGGKTNSSTVTASTVANSDSSPITGLTSSGVYDHASVQASGHEELRVADTIRLGEDEGIAIEMDSGANATRVFGVLFFFFE